MTLSFPLQHLLTLHGQIETPALLVWLPQMEKNIQAMQTLADRHGKKLRPHTKTHKSPYFAKYQIRAGAKGITVAKLSEAEVMAAHGLNDIFIANQITQQRKLKRLFALHHKIRLIIGLDNVQQIALLKPLFQNAQTPLSVRIEIDSGLHRCGVGLNDDLLNLARAVLRERFLKLDGLFTHAGHVYAAKSRNQLEAIGRQEGAVMARAVSLLQKAHIRVDEISVGSTPTAPFSVKNNAVSEIRPGNYIFYDAMQMALGAAQPKQVALFVLATVISRPAADRIVVDAGSKALHTDGATLTGHFGFAANVNGLVARLSEEHGIMQIDPHEKIAIGDPVLLVPNHACAVVNLFDAYYVLDETLQIHTIRVEGRGKSQ